MDAADFEAGQQRDLRALSLSWEDFNLAMKEFQLACRFHQWPRAQSARDTMMMHLEANCDAMVAVNRRIEMAGG